MNIIEIFRNYNARLRLVTYLLLVMLIVLSGGLAYRQLFRYSEYSEKGERQSLRRIIVPGPRGNIYDRDGRLLVGNRPRYSADVFLNELRPEFRAEFKKLRDHYDTLPEEQVTKTGDINIEARRNVVQRYINQVGKILGRSLEIDSKEIERHFGQQLLLRFPLINDMDPEEYALLLEQIPVQSPIQIFASNARYYPYGSLAAHTLGWAGNTQEMDTDNLPGDKLMTFQERGYEGKSGIEKQFDEELQGESGLEIWVVDPSGFQFEPKVTNTPIQGKDLQITLDSELQDIAEMALGDQKGAAIALDTKRGDILVMASKPDYDLNDLSPYMSNTVARDINDRGAWINLAFQGLYSPGSTFKIVTSLAGLRNGFIDGETMSHCTGSYTVGRRNFRCWNRLGHGDVTIHEAIQHSCNVYFYQHGQDIGVNYISAEARRFHLDQPTGVELPFEATKMIVPSREWKRETRNDAWYPGDTANFSIGQGDLRVTPLQMACFTAAFARRETEFKPTILYDPYRQAIPSKRDIKVSESDYNLILDGMEAAATDGTAKLIKVPGVRIAAKTGTAQVQTPDGMRHLAWSICFAPIEDPEIAIAVMIDGQFGDSLGGGSTSVPIAQPILQRFFEKMGHVASR
ncbi:penicillin-binding protein 2 [Opitutia bacterium ISCC 51]|nr:penicillin-binding protein 2 [Opitutae bacterium ISCC 51]QXD26551.1 penicillin-binding protein 2 [Opitutae bacterium ISCC 52]